MDLFESEASLVQSYYTEEPSLEKPNKENKQPLTTKKLINPGDIFSPSKEAGVGGGVGGGKHKLEFSQNR